MPSRMAGIAATVPACPKCKLITAPGCERGERALHDDVGAGVVVVERVDVEAEHHRVAGLSRDVLHDLRRGTPCRRRCPTGGRTSAGCRRSGIVSRQRTTSSSIALRTT